MSYLILSSLLSERKALRLPFWVSSRIITLNSCWLPLEDCPNLALCNFSCAETPTTCQAPYSEPHYCVEVIQYVSRL